MTPPQPEPTTEPGEQVAGPGNRAAAAAALSRNDPAEDQVDLTGTAESQDSLAADDTATQPEAGEPAETDKAARQRPDGV